MVVMRQRFHPNDKSPWGSSATIVGVVTLLLLSCSSPTESGPWGDGDFIVGYIASGNWVIPNQSFQVYYVWKVTNIGDDYKGEVVVTGYTVRDGYVLEEKRHTIDQTWRAAGEERGRLVFEDNYSSPIGTRMRVEW